MKEIVINGVTLKVGSFIETPRIPTSFNIIVTSLYKVNEEIKKVIVRIGCCGVVHLDPEDITKIIR
jgi:hypothetical protein